MFFPSPAERPVPGFVRADFPFPLALTCARLEAQMDCDEPIAAAWALRDAFECAVKFTACAAIADFLQAQPTRDDAAALAALLLKPQGLSLGDWHTLLEIALKSSGRESRRLPELFGVFFQGGAGKKPSRTAVNASIDGSDKSFVTWRNRVFGHGVFREERGYYADETRKRLPDLVRFCEALRPVLAGWRLIGLTPGGERVDWTGCEAPPVATGERHKHKPWGDPLPMRLVPQDHAGRAELDFGPLLTVQRCEVCGEPAAFFFDRHRYDRERDKHRTHFLDYRRGHPGERKDWSEARRLAGLLPAGFEWQRASWDAEEVVEGVRLTFADFETEYLRPAYLLDALWQTVADRPGGYVQVSGPAGLGKTYLVRGLEQESAERGVPVLAYHILPGARADYQTFVGELHATACERLSRARTVQPQVAVGSVAELQEQFAGYLTTLMKANRLDALVLAIDAVDELAEPDGSSPVNAATILDLLPPAEKLPEGCFVVLTSRPEMRPGIRARLDRLRVAAGDERFVALDLRPDAPANEALLRAYLSAHLREPLRAASHVDEVLRRSGGVFLYAYHLARALTAGAFADTAALPEGKEFYPAYLARLRERVGAELHEAVYLPALLLLAAARAPVTLEQLTRWGVPGERLRFALIDLRDFLREHRVRRWHESLNREGDNRYEMAHEAFVRFVSESAEYGPRYRQAHGTIADAALAAHGGRWEEIDPCDEAALYALRFLPLHLRLAGRPEAEENFQCNGEYALGCWKVASTCQAQARYDLAVELFRTVEIVLRRLVEEVGAAELSQLLAMTLSSKGNALWALGRLGEALGCLDEAIAAVRRLVHEEGRAGLATYLGRTCNNKGNVLQGLGRLGEAVGCYDEAIAVLRRLVHERGSPELADYLATALITALINKGAALEAQGRPGDAVGCHDEAIAALRHLDHGGGSAALANNLARALVNKGNALQKVDRLGEAVDCYDEAIAVRRRLVEREGRAELTDDLTLALMNKGVALRSQGRLGEAVACYDEAIALLRRLVHDGGRAELANDLAMTLVNKGVALDGLGRLGEAVGCYDEAIAVLRRLVHDQGHPKSANDLAKALIYRGVAVEVTGSRLEALDHFSEAIRWYEQLIEAGLRHLTPELVNGYMIRFDPLRQMARWGDAAADVTRVVHLCQPILEEGEPTPALVRELTKLLRAVDRLGPEERAQLDAALGDDANLVRQLCERFVPKG
jgi:tetratricopeptide (TPR) repeat protein